jgi:hypothetical protein
MQSDPEHGKAKSNIIGYPSLATFIASDEDRSTAIYRRFNRLAARNLLYLQSELAELEARLDHFDEEDYLHGSREEKYVLGNWPEFKAKADDANNTRERERMKLVMEIREKIKEYREYKVYIIPKCE